MNGSETGREFAVRRNAMISSLLQKTGVALVSKDEPLAEDILNKIPSMFIEIAKKITAHAGAILEDKQYMPAFFRALKIIDKLSKINDKTNSTGKEDFDIWKASDEEISGHWSQLVSLKERFKENQIGFLSNLDGMDVHDIFACANLAPTYSLVLEARKEQKPADFNSTLDLEQHQKFTDIISQRANELRKRNK